MTIMQEFRGKFRGLLVRGYRSLGRALPEAEEAKRLSEIEMILTFYLSQKQVLSIVQVGANDGVSGDPISRFVSKYPQRTRLLLCEPQPEIAKLLIQNLDFHPDVSVFEGGITLESFRSSTADSLLWRVKPEMWEQIESRYSRRNKIPSFRAASGFASSDKSHVLKHIAKFRWKANGRPVNPTDIIEGIPISWCSMQDLIDKYPRFARPDLLVIDVEGLDDRVILSSLEAQVLAPVIFFEKKHLSEENYVFVSRRLEEHGYQVIGVASDAIAIKISK